MAVESDERNPHTGSGRAGRLHCRGCHRPLRASGIRSSTRAGTTVEPGVGDQPMTYRLRGHGSMAIVLSISEEVAQTVAGRASRAYGSDSRATSGVTAARCRAMWPGPRDPPATAATASGLAYPCWCYLACGSNLEIVLEVGHRSRSRARTNSSGWLANPRWSPGSSVNGTIRASAKAIAAR